MSDLSFTGRGKLPQPHCPFFYGRLIGCYLIVSQLSLHAPSFKTNRDGLTGTWAPIRRRVEVGLDKLNQGIETASGSAWRYCSCAMMVVIVGKNEAMDAQPKAVPWWAVALRSAWGCVG